MAKWELQNGKNAELLNTSRSIVTSQTQEIAEMQQYLAQLPFRADCAPAPAPSPSSMVRSHDKCSMVPAWLSASTVASGTYCMITVMVRRCPWVEGLTISVAALIQ